MHAQKLLLINSNGVRGPRSAFTSVPLRKLLAAWVPAEIPLVP